MLASKRKSIPRSNMPDRDAPVSFFPASLLRKYNITIACSEKFIVVCIKIQKKIKIGALPII
jgi:hypothetical protein